MSNLNDFYRQKGLNELKGKVDSNRFLTTEQRELIHQIIDEEMDNDVKDKLRSMTDKQKRALKRKLSGQNEEVEEVKKVEEEMDNDVKDKLKKMTDSQKRALKRKLSGQNEDVELDQNLSFAEKQEALIKFGYDPTNVRYMNGDILEQAYESMINILNAQNPTQE
jgi:DNA-binding transcriptional regulator/RsmH inhibitor MraZ